MKVLILAAGYGTRLYPLITDTPKPLLPVGGKPLINHTLDRIRDVTDISEILVVTNDKFHSHFTEWSRQDRGYAWPIRIINDQTKTPETRLGSVGDIDYVLKHDKITEDLLIIGGDNLFDFDLGSYISFSRKKSPLVTIGLYDIRCIDEASKFGVVAIDKDGKVVSFEEKPEHPRSSLIAMCCYFKPKETLRYVDDYLKRSAKTDKAGDYIRWLTEEKGVYGYRFEGTWYDIGSIESYREAQEGFKE